MRARSSALLSATIFCLAATMNPLQAETADPLPRRPSPGTSAPDRYLVGELLVTRPVVRNGSPDGSPVIMAFVDIANRGKSQDRLMSASIDGAQRTTIADQQLASTGGAAPQPTIAAGADVRMDATGTHIIAEGFQQPLHAGAIVGGQLVFERAGPLTIQFVVESSPVASKP